jgi:hypothetical protein
MAKLEIGDIVEVKKGSFSKQKGIIIFKNLKTFKVEFFGNKYADFELSNLKPAHL